MGQILLRKWNITPMDMPGGEQAHGASKLATAVAYKTAGVYNENAQHATKVAMELDNTRRLIERYIMGTSEDAHREALAAPIEENPQRYVKVPWDMLDGGGRKPTLYPVSGGPNFPNHGIDYTMADRHEEAGPTGWESTEDSGLKYGREQEELAAARTKAKNMAEMGPQWYNTKHDVPLIPDWQPSTFLSGMSPAAAFLLPTPQPPPARRRSNSAPVPCRRPSGGVALQSKSQRYENFL